MVLRMIIMMIAVVPVVGLLIFVLWFAVNVVFPKRNKKDATTRRLS